MQNIDEFGAKIFDGRSVVGLALLAPAVFWWAALAVSLVMFTGLADYLGNSVIQILALVICPLSAAMLSLSTPKHTKLRWMIAFAGIFLAAMALLASLRNS